MCVKMKKNYSMFHFRGFYNGVRITNIIINSQDFELYDEYLICLEVEAINENTLYGNLIKKKRLLSHTYPY